MTGFLKLIASGPRNNMGLDTVELTMAIEDEFGVAFLDADAAKLSRVGDIHSYVLRVLRERGETPDSEAIWERLRAVVVDQLGVRPEEVTTSADIVGDLHAD